MLKYFLYLVLFLTLNLFSYGQQFKTFSSDQNLFLEEMDMLFARSETNYKKGKDLLKQFEEPWLNGKISNYRKENIYAVSNLMLKKKARNFPHFYDYIQTILAFTTNNIDSIQYEEWEKGLVSLLQQKKSKLQNIQIYINNTRNLILYNAIYYSPSVKWYASNNNYDLFFENDTLKIEFKSTDLIAKLRNDSIVISETKGIYYPITQTWVGNGAKVFWEKTGLGRDSTYAKIDNYKIKLNKAQYTLSNVEFHNKYYFDYPLIGTLSDKVVETSGNRKISYPKFESNEKRFEIKGIFQDIDFVGGFNMNGANVVGSGNEQQYATLSLYRDIEFVENGDTVIKKQLFMKTYSLFYSLTNTNIISRNAKISMFIENDSIYHPGLMFKYDDNYREINLIRDDNPENFSRSVYYNTYHKIEMDFELLKWRMDEKNVDFTMLRGTSINIAQFESQNYFSANRYFEDQGLEDVHPYILLRRFSNTFHTQEFYVEDFSKFIRMPITVTKRLLIQLTYKGIVDYDFQTGYCTIQQKMYNYLDAIVGKIDYDLIQFESRTTAPQNNATLDLQNMNIAIEGIPMINVSDSQNVIFYPRNQQILLKKNRDFDFGGTVVAGLFEYYGDNFQFKYDSFKIDLKHVDSLSIKVKAGVDNWGRRVLANVENVLENITGDLIIDDPGNKSGIKDNPEYPIFKSKQNSYVYYDNAEIQKGKYIRDRFFFEVDPYTIDSLNNFSTEGMGYDGVLISADIFPPIRQRLVLQKDNSLGFHQHEPTGITLYKGKGTYYNEIHLSNQGLRGDGYMEYITSKETSDDFIFYPDSTNAYTTDFYIEELAAAVQYPEVKAAEVYMHWMPYQDSLYSNTIEESFSMFRSKSKHTGSLVYTPKQLTGKGLMEYNKADLTSDLFKYNAMQAFTDSAGFELASVNEGKLSFLTDNISGKVDFTIMESEFKSNTKTGKAELPENLYEAYIEQFAWKMNDQTMQLATPNTIQVYEYGRTSIVNREEAGLTPKGSLFISVHSGQDSLNWVSPVADFDLKTNIINAHEVKYILVADATIFPNEGEVTVEPVARMRTLRNAELLANNDTRYHNFHSATINISSRKKYHGEAKYNYEDEIGREQTINFDMIAVDSTGMTFANGKIKGIDDFSLSPAFAYQGNVHLEAPKKLLEFDGSMKINHNCADISTNWVKFTTDIDPKNIYIPIGDQPKDINESFLVSGPMTATDSIHVYPSFLSPRKAYSNFPVATANGFLYFDKKSKQYKIGSKARIHDNDTSGNIISLHKNYCELYSDGDINLGARLGQVKMITKGNSIYKIKEDKLTLDLVGTLDFFIPDECLKIIADTLQTLSGLSSVNLKRKTYQKGMVDILGYKPANDMFKEQNIFGTIKQVPELLNTSFVFGELKLKWNKKNNSWVSTGPIGIANILGQQVNRKTGGYLEIIRRRSGDEFTLYIEISETHWYFFNYKRGLMQFYSSEARFNDIITSIKGSDRKLKIERGETSYVFFLSNIKKRNDFLDRILGKNTNEEEDEEEDFEQYEEYD